MKDFAGRTVLYLTDKQHEILKSLVSGGPTFFDVIDMFGMDEVYEVVHIVEDEE